jgi:HEAT repeat protein
MKSMFHKISATLGLATITGLGVAIPASAATFAEWGEWVDDGEQRLVFSDPSLSDATFSVANANTWRVETPATAKDAQRLQTRLLLSAGFAKTASAELIALLGHRDQRVRQGAQLELAKRGQAEALLAVARDAAAPLLARVHALWGYGQLLRRAAAPVAAAWPLLADADAEIRTQAAKILGDAASAKPDAKRLIPLLSDTAPRVRLQAAIALGKHAEPAAVDALFAFAAADAGDVLERANA